MITILTWVSIIAGGLLILLMTLSVIGGLDLDLDVGSADVDADTGGIGLIKGLLTFISVSSWVIKISMTMNHHPGVALVIGVICGFIAFLLLNYLFRLLLRNEENVNWKFSDAMLQKGEVYLKIPVNGSGIVSVEINGAKREVKAKTRDNEELATGEKIVVVDIDGDILIVDKD